MIREIEEAPAKTPVNTTKTQRLAGTRVGMVMFSHYPFDPRPRRSIDALVGEGAHVDLICLKNEGAATRETLKGIEIFRIPLKHSRRGKFDYAFRYSIFISWAAAIFARRMLGQRYDLIYVHNMPDILVASGLLPKIFGAKIVLDLHDPMPELMMTIFRTSADAGSVKWMERLEKWSIGRADLVVTVSETFKQLFASRSCPPDKIAVVMNSPDGRIFPLRQPQFRPFPTVADKKPFIVMYHGSLVERNGLGVAIDALVRVREMIPHAELHVFGQETAFLTQMLEVARQKGIGDAVRYFGPRQLEDLVGEIDKCDIGVIPNQKNAFTDINTPTRIFEYLALGKPVVAPASKGIQDYFGKDSLIFFAPGDSDDLARKIVDAYFHPDELPETVRRGQKIFEEHTWAHERETLVSRVSAILEKRAN